MKNLTIKDLKSEIKSLSKKQRETKEQRKSVKFNGTRSLTPKDAQMLALKQKEELKHMFIAYALLRGKPIESTISKETMWSKNRVDDLMLIYKHEEVVCVSAD